MSLRFFKLETHFSYQKLAFFLTRNSLTTNSDIRGPNGSGELKKSDTDEAIAIAIKE